MIALRRIYGLLLLLSLPGYSFSQMSYSPCADLAREIAVDQIILDDLKRLPELPEAQYYCLGQYYAQQDLLNQEVKLFDQIDNPVFHKNGQLVCKLESEGIHCQTIPASTRTTIELAKLAQYITGYNELILDNLSQRIGTEEVNYLFFHADKTDPYELKEKLAHLTRKRNLFNIQEISPTEVNVTIAVQKLFKELPIDIQQLRFIVIDETQKDIRYELTSAEISKEGFRLKTLPIRQYSRFLYDFRIRIDYSRLIEEDQIFTCEKVENFLFHYLHYSITKDQRIVPHKH